MHNIYIYIFLSALTSFIIRVLPLTLLRKPITNQFIKSFLYYVPYVTLSVMIFPAIIHTTQNIISGLIALIVGIVVAWYKNNLPLVAATCCLVVFLLEKML